MALTTTAPTTRLWWLRLLALATIWGTSFLLIKVALDGFGPLQIAFGRVVIGALVLILVVVAGRDALPRDPRMWWHLGVAGLLLNSVPFVLFGLAEQRISSSLAGICNAATPLFTVLLTLAALRQERPAPRRIVGLLLGFGGVLVVLDVGNTAGAAAVDPAAVDPAAVDAVGVGMVLGAALCYALGWVYLRRYVTGSPYSGVALSAGQLATSTVQLAAVMLVATELPAAFPLAPVLAVVALGALGTGFAYVLQYRLIRDVGVTVAATVTYVIPVVAVAAGIAVLGEHLHPHQLVGAAVILGGAYLSRPLSDRGASHRSRA
ncbi:DMT family transporter [Pseudonocardia sp. TRM90224]|uniref:DMT family transporter n=1 Tax=Pseudonocardia sp. TRM90224 TaxID=2812678 RepID=UPI001E3F5DD2|nr:DMT family transporter [Pseudonocardia sp. TRM90224]